MSHFKNSVVRFLREEDGLSAVEYAIAGGLVVAGMVGAFTQLGTAATARIAALVTAVGG